MQLGNGLVNHGHCLCHNCCLASRYIHTYYMQSKFCSLTYTDLHHHGSILKSCEAVTSETASNVGAGAITTQIRRDTTFIDIWQERGLFKNNFLMKRSGVLLLLLDGMLVHHKVALSSLSGCHKTIRRYPNIRELPRATHIREFKKLQREAEDDVE